MKIGYCTIQDPLIQNAWSGIDYYMLKALRKQCGDVVPLGPLRTGFEIPGKFTERCIGHVFGKVFDYRYMGFISSKIEKILNDRIKKEHPDLLFFPAGSLLLAHLKSSLPVIYYSDATFKAISDYYPEYSRMLTVTRDAQEQAERRSIQRADIIVYASEWARTSAVNDYHCDQRKCHVVELGANLEFAPPRGKIMTQREKTAGALKLLFVGKDWQRKGGDIAFQTAMELNRRKIDTELYICGCRPNIRNEKVKIIGYLDKNNPADVVKLHELYLAAAFFIFPTRFEASGIVICEASAYGLPVISTDTGGVSSHVENGVNGYLFSPEAGYNLYADIIQKVWEDKEAYLELCNRAIDKYERRLNWDSWGKSIKEIMQEYFSRKKLNNNY